VYIYGLENPKTGEIRYVGKTARPIIRLASHLQQPHTEAMGEWIGSLQKQQLEPKIKILEEVSDGDDWRAQELHWIMRMQEQGADLINSQRDIDLANRGCPKGTVDGLILLTVRIPPELHRAFKLACVKRGLTMSEVLRALIEQAIRDAARERGGEEEE